MVVEILPNAGKAGLHVDAHFVEMIGVANAREHQKLGGSDSARCHQHFALGAVLLLLLILHHLHAGGPLAVDKDARGQHPRLDGKIRTRLNRAQIADRGTTAATVAGCGLVGAGAKLVRTIKIVVEGNAHLLIGFHKSLGQRMNLGQVRDAERPLVPMPWPREPSVALGAEKVGLDLCKAPTITLIGGGPLVIIFGHAAGKDLRVDGAATANHPPLGQRDHAILAVLLGHAAEFPIVHTHQKAKANGQYGSADGGRADQPQAAAPARWGLWTSDWPTHSQPFHRPQ